MILVRIQAEIHSLVAKNTLKTIDCAWIALMKIRLGKRSTEEEQLSSHFSLQRKNGTTFTSSTQTAQKESSTKIHSDSIEALKFLQR